MKHIAGLALLLAGSLGAVAQTPSAENVSDRELAAFAREYVLGTPFRSYDTVTGDRVVYSGILVQVFRAPQPLQLLNPWAPRAYEPSQGAVAVDPLTRRPVGLRLFAIHF